MISVILSGMLLNDDNNVNRKSSYKSAATNEEIEQALAEAKLKHKSIMLKKGLKEFCIEGQIVYALNLNNAIRKVNNPLKQKGQ